MQYTNPHLIFTTFFGLGKISGRIAGTIGSLVAFPLTFYCFKLSKLLRPIISFDHTIIDSIAIPLICVIILFIFGCISSSIYSKQTANIDPKEVIIDEIVGQMLCIILTIPLSLLFFQLYFATYPLDLALIGMLAANFILFRFFDILKPWPISWVEKRFKSGFGIMFDDIVAALFATLVYYAAFLNIIDRFK
jgi:phosphatidylglycerophosphatase A